MQLGDGRIRGLVHFIRTAAGALDQRPRQAVLFFKQHLQKVFGRKLLVLALRDIEPGEEITVDYVSTMHSDRKRCTCKVPGCRGTINKLSAAG